MATNDGEDAPQELGELRRQHASGNLTPAQAYARDLSMEGALQSRPPEATALATAPAPPASSPSDGQPPKTDDIGACLLFDGPDRLSRLLLFVKFMFVVPLLLWLAIYRAAALVVAFFAFWAILFTGRYPPGLFGFVRGYVSSHYRVYSYFPLLLTDGWTAGEKHPLRFVIEPSPRQSRLLLIFTKLPAMVLGVFYGIASIGTSLLTIVAIPMWFVILATGRYPAGLRGWSLGVLQWSARVTAWQFMMSDDWRFFGSSLKVRIPTIIAAYTVPGLMMWATFSGASFGLPTDLFGVGEGMEVVDGFMAAGRDRDVAAANALMASGAARAGDIDNLFRTRYLFDGYEKAKVRAWSRVKNTSAGDTLQLQGELSYASGKKGSFYALLRKDRGTWMILSINIQRPP